MPSGRPQPAARIRRAAPLALALAALLAAASCASDGDVRRAPANAAMAARMKQSNLTLESLQELNYSFADRYFTTIAAACDQIIADNPDPRQRAAAAEFKVSYVTAVFDIVTSGDPLSQVVDLALVVTLQSQIFIDDARADELFGDRAQPLIEAIRRSREEIWTLGARLFNVDEQDYFDRLIWAWRKNNPHLTFVGFVRFDEFANERAIRIVQRARSSGGFLSEVDEARRAVEDARLLAEHVFFLAKRLPTLLQWQAEAAADNILLQPSIAEFLDNHKRIAPALDGVAANLETLGADLLELRDGAFREIDARIAGAEDLLARSEGALAEVRSIVEAAGPLLESARPIAADLRDASASLDASSAAAERIVQRVTVPEGDPRFRPFDIDEYTAAAAQLADAARELRQTLDRAEGLLDSDALDDRINAQRLAIAADAASLIDRLFWRLIAVVAVVFVLLAAYRAVGARARRPAAP